jgi:hypothetical protein
LFEVVELPPRFGRTTSTDRQLQELRIRRHIGREAQRGRIEALAGNGVPFTQPGKVQARVQDSGGRQGVDFVQRRTPTAAVSRNAFGEVVEVVLLHL